MKVVINKCYGGFGLSLKAERLYLEKKGKQCFHYRQTKYNHSDGESEYKKITGDDKRSLLMIHTSTVDHGDIVSGDIPDDGYFYCGSIDRADTDLIEVVEELGDEANGWAAELSVVEIPDNISYEIAEYDGIEHIAEAHRTWE